VYAKDDDKGFAILTFMDIGRFSSSLVHKR
jgi:hypothetical protein